MNKAITDEEAIGTVTEIYEEEKAISEKTEWETIGEHMNALNDHIKDIADESEKLVYDMESVVHEYESRGANVPRDVIARAVVVNYMNYCCRNLVDEMAKGCAGNPVPENRKDDAR